MKNIDEKIKKIVALIDGAATEGEARAASLALQRLLVANHLTLEDINLDDSPVEVGEEVCELGRRIPEWKKILAKVVANNYRCRVYTSYSEIRDLFDCRTKGRTASSSARATIPLSHPAALGRAPTQPRTVSDLTAPE